MWACSVPLIKTCRRRSLMVTSAAAVLAQGIHAVSRHCPKVASLPCASLLPSLAPRPCSCCRRKGENKWLARERTSQTSLISLVPRAGRFPTTTAEGVRLLQLVCRGGPPPLPGLIGPKPPTPLEGGGGEARSRGRPGSESLPEPDLTLSPTCGQGQLAPRNQELWVRRTTGPKGPPPDRGGP